MHKRFIVILFLFVATLSFGDVGFNKDSDIYVISIGINNYSGNLYPLRFCVNDANNLVHKLIADNPKRTRQDIQDYINKYGRGSGEGYPINKVIPYLLTDEQATLENIRNAFKEVISKATYGDYFIFLFSGFSMESESNETYLVPYSDNYQLQFTQSYEHGNRLTQYNPRNLFSLIEMAKLMEQIACKNQLVISDAGSGKAFGQNLISELFESNPLIAKGTERNRIILTTKEYGMESETIQSGYLMKYIMNSGNILDAFKDFIAYEYKLIQQEVAISFGQRKYIASYLESDFRNILLKNYSKTSSARGSVSKKVKDESPKGNNEHNKSQETYAFVVATDSYNKNQTSWNDLKNPIHDAEVFSNVLEEKYGVQVKKVYNKTKNEILKEFLEFKQQIDENDKLLFFVAGHGYYSEDFYDGYLVMEDSHSLEEDPTLDTYFSMAKLNRLLDGVPCKQVFSIFDVCYGASFELNNADLPIENYANAKFDNGVDAFIQERDKNISRIVLASGQYEVPDYWKDSQDHSPFADKLIKALKSESNFISPGKIFSYVQGNATTPILKQFGKHEPRGDFLLKVN